MQKVTKYLVYTERQTKTLGLQLTPRMADDAPFYLGINVTKKDGSKKLVQVGTHGCHQTKHFDENDGFESKHRNNERLTNHSARK